jgi:opacity protein-like surface antigen
MWWYLSRVIFIEENGHNKGRNSMLIGNRIAKVLFIISVFIVVLPLYSLAAEDSSSKYTKPYYVSLKAGIYSPTGDLEDFSTGFNGEITINRYFSPNFAIETSFGYFQTDYNGKDTAFGTGFSSDADIYSIPITATLKGIIPLVFGELYAGVGGGVQFVDGDIKINSSFGQISVDDSDAIWSLQFIGGLDFDLTESFFVGIEGKYLITDDAEVGPFEFNLNGYFVSGVLGYRF